MVGAKSTFTRWIGPIMVPEFVKNRETSSPRSAIREIFSAEAALAGLRIFFIKLLLLFRRLPQSPKMVVLALVIFPYLKNEGIKPVRDPSNGALLLWNIQALVKIKRM